MTVSRKGFRVLLSTVPSDSHTWNLVFLQLALEELGYSVTNLGPCVPESLLLETAAETLPDAVVISTVNGHGFAEGEKLIRGLRAVERLRGMPVMIGGKLGTEGGDDAAVRSLLESGYTAVFSDDADVGSLVSSLERLGPGGSARRAVPEREQAIPEREQAIPERERVV